MRRIAATSRSQVPHNGKRVGSGGAGVDEERGAPVVTDHEQGVLNERAAGEGEDLHAECRGGGPRISYTVKELPQPHPPVACGFLNENPEPINDVT